ncbi:MAG: hypothetical protein KDD45_08075, partial [Bdellovibrionales bacterium]|nr:hypothetical protein [Bdellovibrionales bacterium]
HKFIRSFKFFTYLFDSFIFIVDYITLILPKFHELLEFFVKGLFDTKYHVSHHHNLVSFRVIRIQFKRIVEQRPLFLIKNLLDLL